MSTPPRNDRRSAIADGALAVLASSGSRGLTHRAVDAHLGTPQGTTSRYFRTRKALLAGAMSRMVELSLAQSRVAEFVPKSRAEVAKGLAAIIERMLAPASREHELARQELSLEARRDEDLREIYTGLRDVFMGQAVRLAKDAGCVDPERTGPALAVFVNGLIVERLVHEDQSRIPPADVAAHIERLLTDP